MNIKRNFFIFFLVILSTATALASKRPIDNVENHADSEAKRPRVEERQENQSASTMTEQERRDARAKIKKIATTFFNPPANCSAEKFVRAFGALNSKSPSSTNTALRIIINILLTKSPVLSQDISVSQKQFDILTLLAQTDQYKLSEQYFCQLFKNVAQRTEQMNPLTFTYYFNTLIRMTDAPNTTILKTLISITNSPDTTIQDIFTIGKYPWGANYSVEEFCDLFDTIAQQTTLHKGVLLESVLIQFFTNTDVLLDGLEKHKQQFLILSKLAKSCEKTVHFEIFSELSKAIKENALACGAANKINWETFLEYLMVIVPIIDCSTARYRGTPKGRDIYRSKQQTKTVVHEGIIKLLLNAPLEAKQCMELISSCCFTLQCKKPWLATAVRMSYFQEIPSKELIELITDEVIQQRATNKKNENIPYQLLERAIQLDSHYAVDRIMQHQNGPITHADTQYMQISDKKNIRPLMTAVGGGRNELLKKLATDYGYTNRHERLLHAALRQNHIPTRMPVINTLLTMGITPSDNNALLNYFGPRKKPEQSLVSMLIAYLDTIENDTVQFESLDGTTIDKVTTQDNVKKAFKKFLKAYQQNAPEKKWWPGFKRDKAPELWYLLQLLLSRPHKNNVHVRTFLKNDNNKALLPKCLQIDNRDLSRFAGSIIYNDPYEFRAIAPSLTAQQLGYLLGITPPNIKQSDMINYLQKLYEKYRKRDHGKPHPFATAALQQLVTLRTLGGSRGNEIQLPEEMVNHIIAFTNPAEAWVDASRTGLPQLENNSVNNSPSSIQ